MADFFRADAERVALVTGAGSGIGAATARRLVAEGVGRLVLTDRDGAAVSETAAELKIKQEDILAAAFDVADEDAWLATCASIRERFGRLDFAVANAGVTTGGSIVEYPFADWRRVMSTNLDGVFLTLKSCLKLIEEGGRGGAVVVVSSVTGIKAQPGTATYGASKAAVLQLARVAAKEGAAHQIRVNAILPGGTETPIWRTVPSFNEQITKTGSEQGAFDAMGRMLAPLGRFSKAEEIAGQIAFLLSDVAANITGAELVADGGYAI